MKKALWLLAVLALSGCETPVTKDEMDAYNYGPKPANWQDEIRSYLSLRLRDPKSAIVEFRTEPKQFYQRQVALDPEQHGWAVCVWVNDKNGEGAYEGFRPMTFFLRNEKIVAANNDPDHRGPIYAEYAKRQCASLGAPFKE
ncbi:MAG: hypothetical protein JO035_02485 [Betaproteobacteria bacterium]|nr:hypothetical protein [Betaproteobacteria bacterium]